MADDLARIAARFERTARPVWLWDVERARILWANASGLKFWGADSVFDLIEYAFDKKSGEAETLRRTGRGMETMLYPPGGGVRVRLEAAAVDLGQGREGRLVMVQAARAANAEFKPEAAALFRDAPVGLCLVDAAGAVTRFNTVAAELLGNKPTLGGLLGQNEAARFLLQIFSRGSAHISAQAKQTRLSLTGVRVKYAGGDAALMRVEDVTIRRALEILLQRRAHALHARPAPAARVTARERVLEAALKEAERKSQAKTDFLNQLSHEMRNPLNAIIGFSEIMQGEHFGPLGDERYASYAGDIRNSAGYLLSLVNDLLDMAKIESGKFALDFDSVSLPVLIEDCVRLSKPQASSHGVSLYTLAPANLPPVVADARSLKQVLINLISNAIKFTARGGSVLVSAEPDPAGGILVTVSDTGIGMSAGDVQLALEPFGQVDGPLQRKRKGTGLGLPLAKALVEANKAIFRIESEPEHGTQVKVLFPSTRVLTA